ncbi:hypothetical protein QO002_004414 [Pararhizobium capsulatum DSM 1112]|uniref:DUF2188 domain-containing protein n=1 Tax=Pararhizobium capsulatum DSM 1112 TaxID=1121113 RepID=A0ABU0BW84_9HYPH|nr:hypothetical protein [Pararhizobium capsulatum]MDQ0322208.1 hypothetical protein [Pararhizobium capsulatum DSM 1112]
MTSPDSPAARFEIQRYDKVWVVTVYQFDHSEHRSFQSRDQAAEFGNARVKIAAQSRRGPTSPPDKEG